MHYALPPFSRGGVCDLSASRGVSDPLCGSYPGLCAPHAHLTAMALLSAYRASIQRLKNTVRYLCQAGHQNFAGQSLQRWRNDATGGGRSATGSACVSGDKLAFDDAGEADVTQCVTKNTSAAKACSIRGALCLTVIQLEGRKSRSSELTATAMNNSGYDIVVDLIALLYT